MKLWEIESNIESLLSKAIDPETGELIDEGALDELEELQMAKEEKIENCLLVIKNLDAEEKALADTIKGLQSRKNTTSKNKEWLKGYVQRFLNGEKYKSATSVVSYRKSQAVEIVDADAVPEEFLKIKKEPDKTAIRVWIKNGNAVEGAQLVDRQSMIIK